ncbi:hypothetical protein Vadar_028480 [Vaccinium darrowii]|uniref:Uncharacterized protein n=1 Tax=Vaccinium darrowii TaxID=229202 RepID=A0ACB7YHT3_9ERIC|nr:hypothetical protein Vadar_028480 [Vaccinium darrowii]
MTTEDLCRPILYGPDVEDQKGDNREDNDEANGVKPKVREIIVTEWCRAAMARHGKFTLLFVAAAATAPASLHLILFYFRFTRSVPADPSLYLTACLTNVYLWVSSLLVSLWSFFPWAEAEKGFRRNPATVVVLFLVYFSLGVAWDPVTIGLGAVKVGILISLVRLAFGIAIGRMLCGLSCMAGKCVTEAGGLLSFYILLHTFNFVEMRGDWFKWIM